MAAKVLLAVAMLASLPAVVVLVGVLFHHERAHAFLVRHGRAIALMGFVASGVCLAAYAASREPGWQLAGSVLALGLAVGVALARARAASP